MKIGSIMFDEDYKSNIDHVQMVLLFMKLITMLLVFFNTAHNFKPLTAKNLIHLCILMISCTLRATLQILTSL